MTRYEAHLKLDNNDNKRIRKHKIIDEIYDTLKSRVCKNCKFYNIEHFLCNVIPESDGWIFDELDRSIANVQFCPDEDFGCNRFEWKKDA